MLSYFPLRPFRQIIRVAVRPFLDSRLGGEMFSSRQVAGFGVCIVCMLPVVHGQLKKVMYHGLAHPIARRASSAHENRTKTVTETVAKPLGFIIFATKTAETREE